ncbi:MAG: hypothetical protein V1703_00145 [Candidatus Altiarchaeota archaeon]
MRRKSLKASEAFSLVYGIILVLMAVAVSIIVYWAAFIILKNNQEPAKVFSVVAWVFWFTSLMAGVLSFHRLHNYIKNNKKHLYETLAGGKSRLLQDYFPFMLLEYKALKLLRYMASSDSHDDRNSLYYKNMVRLSVTSFFVLFILMALTRRGL